MTKRRSLEIHPKVAAGGLSGCVSLIILWVASYWIIVPPEVAAAFTTVLSSLGAWLTPQE